MNSNSEAANTEKYTMERSFICDMQCERIHMRNSYALSSIAKRLAVSIIIENLEKCKAACVSDVIQLMLLELKQGQKVAVKIKGSRRDVIEAQSNVVKVMQEK